MKQVEQVILRQQTAYKDMSALRVPVIAGEQELPTKGIKVFRNDDTALVLVRREMAGHWTATILYR